MDPEVVGNGQRVLVTEMAGRASVELKAAELGLDLAGHPEAISSVVAEVKAREARGWSFEAADASLELLMRSALADGNEPVVPFTLDSYRVITEHRADGEVVAEATVKILIDGPEPVRVIATREGNGPVNALDAALRAALQPHCPWLDDIELADYKVRILNPEHGPGHGTDAVTRVLLRSHDAAGTGDWTTVGVHGNVVEASWLALVDALTYASSRSGAVPTEAGSRTPVGVR